MNKADELAVAEALNQLRERNNNKEKQGIPHKSCPSRKSRAQKDADGLLPPLPGNGTKCGSEETVPLNGSAEKAAQHEEIPKQEGTAAVDPPHANGGIPETERLIPEQLVQPPPGQPQQHQWRSVLLTATSLVLTKDTRKKLRHLLKVLRLASEHLKEKVNALQDAMEQDADNDNVKPKISKIAIRNDIVTTIKKCLTMLSTMATNSLPAAVHGRVRNTLLKLPSKWANQLGNETIFESDGKSESAVLALATETLISIHNITNILAESVERADSWVERLPDFRLGKRRREDRAAAESEAADPLNPVESPCSGARGSQPPTRPESPAGPESKAIKIEKGQ